MSVTAKIKPNSARMWDYVMGGSHHFAVDRAAVRLAQKLFPWYEESMREQRRFLQRAVTYMAKEKQLDTFLDFGSGLPTRGNVHQVVQAINPRATVIYSDKDPLSVAFGQELLSDTPDVTYVFCDIADPDDLFTSPEVCAFVGDDRQVGIGVIGLFLYVPDTPLASFFDTLYNWVDKGSYIAVTCARKKVDTVSGVKEASKKMGMQFYTRSRQKILDVVSPWKITEHGLVPGFYWGLPEHAPEINEEIKAFSYSFVAYK